jgi:hypothetical protein
MFHAKQCTGPDTPQGLQVSLFCARHKRCKTFLCAPARAAKCFMRSNAPIPTRRKGCKFVSGAPQALQNVFVRAPRGVS